MPDYDSLDRSLEALKPYGPSLKSGLSNHVPMAAEALCAMGEAAASAQWVQAQLDSIARQPKPVFGLDPKHWQDGLATSDLYADWQRYFETEIEALGWQKALDKWAGRMAPGLFASATHGLIRAGHAARALADADTPLRRRELSEGLAVWASSYQPLPTDRSAAHPMETIEMAFDRLPRIPAEKRKTQGLITDALKPLDDMPEFAGVIGWINLDEDPGAIANQLAARQARVFLDHVHTPLLAIVFTHSITSVHAVLNMVPHISPSTTKDLLAFGWQAGAALYASYAEETVRSDPPAAEANADIIAHAVANGDDHVIKLSEACLSFYGCTGDRIFLQVPAHARTFLHGD